MRTVGRLTGDRMTGDQWEIEKGDPEIEKREREIEKGEREIEKREREI